MTYILGYRYGNDCYIDNTRLPVCCVENMKLKKMIQRRGTNRNGRKILNVRWKVSIEFCKSQVNYVGRILGGMVLTAAWNGILKGQASHSHPAKHILILHNIQVGGTHTVLWVVGVGFLSCFARCVPLQVQREVVGASECSVAELAFERPSTCVFPVVPSQLIWPRKPPRTAFPRACIWLLSCVWPLMRFEVAALCVDLVASWVIALVDTLHIVSVSSPPRLPSGWRRLSHAACLGRLIALNGRGGSRISSSRSRGSWSIRGRCGRNRRWASRRRWPLDSLLGDSDGGPHRIAARISGGFTGWGTRTRTLWRDWRSGGHLMVWKVSWGQLHDLCQRRDWYLC